MIAHCEKLILHHPPYGFTKILAGEILEAVDWPESSFEQTLRKISSIVFLIFAQLPALLLDLLAGGAAKIVHAIRVRWPGVDEVKHLRDSVRMALTLWPEGPQKKQLGEAIAYGTVNGYNPFQIVAEWAIAHYLESGRLPRFLAVLKPLKNGQTITRLAVSFGQMSQPERSAILGALRTQKEPDGVRAEARQLWTDIHSFALQGNPGYITAYKKHLES